MKNSLLNRLFSLLILIAFIFASCDSEEPASDPTPEESSSLHVLTARVDGSDTEITNINLDNGLQTSFRADCMVVSSRVYDKATQSIGYTACDNTFRMVSTATGEELISYPLPGQVAMAVINETEHVLIGTYYDQNAMINHVIRMDLDNGQLLSDIAVEGLGPMYTCSQFFDQGNQTFSIINGGSRILNVDAVNGTITSSVGINSGSNVISYVEDTKTLLAITYEQSNDTNFIEKTNVETGELIQRTEILMRNDYKICASSFDSDSNSLVTVNAENQVIFINIDTGEVTNNMTLPRETNPLTFYAR